MRFFFIAAILVFCAAAVIMSAGSSYSPPAFNAGGPAIAATPPPPAPDTPKGELTDFDWRQGGFGSVVIVSRAVIKNTGTVPIKDFKIACIMKAPSGTVLAAPSATVYDVVKPGQMRTFKDVNLGFTHSQAKSASCRLVL